MRRCLLLKPRECGLQQPKKTGWGCATPLQQWYYSTLLCVCRPGVGRNKPAGSPYKLPLFVVHEHCRSRVLLCFRAEWRWQYRERQMRRCVCAAAGQPRSRPRARPTLSEVLSRHKKRQPTKQTRQEVPEKFWKNPNKQTCDDFSRCFSTASSPRYITITRQAPAPNPTRRKTQVM